MKERFIQIQEYASAFLMVMMSIIVFIQVLTRFVFHIPLPWTEELAKLLLIWLTYLALAATFSRGYHIRIDIIDQFITGKIGPVVDLVIQMLGLVFSVVTFRFVYYYFQSQLEFSQSTPVLSIPMYVVLIPILLGMIFTFFTFLLESISVVKKIMNKGWEEAE